MRNGVIAAIAILLILISHGSAIDPGKLTVAFGNNSGHFLSEFQKEPVIYGISQIPTQNESQPLNIWVVKVDNGIEEKYRELQISTADNISLTLEPGKYKVFTQIQGDDTISEYNNNSDGYLVTVGNETVITYYPSNPAYYYIDAPWRIESSLNNIPILAVDTTNNWADINNIYVIDNFNNSAIVSSTNWVSPRVIEYGDPQFFLFSIDKNKFKRVNGNVSILIHFDLNLAIDYYEGPIMVNISSEDLPRFDNWYYGDTHQHTNYTYNIYEIGAPIYATIAADRALGLDWMIVTDHSFDLDNSKWTQQRDEVQQNSTSYFRVIQGEEVSCYLPGISSLGYQQYNHLLVYN